MNSKERVLATLKHKEPDRVPLALCGSAYGVVDELWDDLQAELGISCKIQPFRGRHGHSVNYIDDRVLRELDIDTRHVWLGSTDLISPKGGVGTDAFGVKWKRTESSVYPYDYPLSDADKDDIKSYSMPDVESLIRPKKLENRLNELDCDQYALIARAPVSYGLYEKASQLRGPELLFKDLMINEEFVEILLSKLFDFYLQIHKRYMEIVGERIDIFELPGDDYADNQGLLFSPQVFRKYFFERWKKLVSIIKQASPQTKVLFHSDGYTPPLLDLLLDIGIDIHHPLEPLPKLDVEKVSRSYSDKLVFLGGIDVKSLSKSFDEGLRGEILDFANKLAKSGGFIMGPTNHIQSDVPAKNIIKAFQLGKSEIRYE
ncbi:hypothetical protein KGY79_03090 [Candidatus Bipolaricaulota bacterium]|nr:hypothetical protein [Candidatus Bipolaricaulota bacterium]